ncbi:TPM domain-containing protein [uncultured Alistipes sp.]|uniref:TPM domain-containing protein n=1 Tax=uncultured Alistipes sp. TaxID=538949 RepID=UPI0011DCC2F8|nr:TPM domain-containing protein [uncultured Alistipes sp.]
MKRYLLCCLLLLAAAGVGARTYRIDEIPHVQRADRNRYVSNPDGILSSGCVARLDTICASLRERGIAQVAVVAVDDVAGESVFDFAIELFRSWGVGRRDADNGLGILLVRDRREIRFVTGGGLEGVLPDAVCKRIQLNYMLPAFREEDYDRGMLLGVEAAAQLLRGGELDFGPDEADDELPAWAVLSLVGLFFLLPLGLGLLGYVRRTRCPRCGRLGLRPEASKTVSLTPVARTVEVTYVCAHCGQTVRRRETHRRDNGLGRGGGPVAGGLGGFGGGRGGFGGGFGGGSFGGGGAGSKW